LRQKRTSKAEGQWQREYAAFSEFVESTAGDAYIDNQAEHHKRRDFREEFLALLRKHNVPFDPEKVFD
jgi:putative transposase